MALAIPLLPPPPLPGPSGGDHFAPKYLLGITTNGYPAVPLPAPYRYIPEPGDGSGLATALAEAAINPGPIYISAGNILFDAGATVGPLTVPPGVELIGSGRGITNITGKLHSPFGGVFELSANSSISDMTIEGGSTDTPSGIAVAVVDLKGVSSVSRCKITAHRPAAGAMRAALRLSYGGAPLQFSIITDCQCIFTNAGADPAMPPIAGILNESSDGSGVLRVHDSVTDGGNYGAFLSAGSLAIDGMVCLSTVFGGIVTESSSGNLRALNFAVFIGSDAGWCGVDVRAGGPTDLSAGVAIGDGGIHLVACGFRFSAPGGVNGQVAQNLFAFGMGTAYQLGDKFGGSANLVQLEGCVGQDIQATGIAVIGANACSVTACRIDMSDGGGPPPLGIRALPGTTNCVFDHLQIRNASGRGSAGRIEGSGHSINGSLFQAKGDSNVLFVTSTQTPISGNRVEQIDAILAVPALRIEGNDSPVTGNSAIMFPGSGVSAIEVDVLLGNVEGCSITGNTTTTDNGISGILLGPNSTHCAATGNVARNAGAGNAVVDTGVGNLLTGNLGF